MIRINTEGVTANATPTGLLTGLDVYYGGKCLIRCRGKARGRGRVNVGSGGRVSEVGVLHSRLARYLYVLYLLVPTKELGAAEGGEAAHYGSQDDEQ